MHWRDAVFLRIRWIIIHLGIIFYVRCDMIYRRGTVDPVLLSIYIFCNYAITHWRDTILAKYVSHLLHGKKPSVTYENMYIQVHCLGNILNTLKIVQQMLEGNTQFEKLKSNHNYYNLLLIRRL